MRVMHVVHSLEHGGQERVIADLVRHAPSPVESSVLVGQGGGPLEQVIAEAGGRVLHLEAGSRRAAVRSAIAAWRPDVIHAHNAWAMHAAAEALGRREPRPALLATRHGQWLPSGALARWRYRRACRRFDTIVSVSETSARSAIAAGFLQAERSEVIRNGIDLDRFATRQVAAPQGHAAGTAPVVVFVGRLEPIKGLMDLLEAACQLHRVRPDVRFAIIGEGSERDALAARLRHLGLEQVVDLSGPVLDVAPSLQAAAIGVLPSFSEGISISLLEMMACGLPVVATAVGGTPEFVRNEETGLLVSPGHPEELASALLRVLADGELAARLGSAAAASVRREYAVATMAAAYASAYAALLRPGRAA